jgi:hypothetical protein
MGTTATSAETAAAAGRAPPPAVGLVLWLGVLLTEGFVVLMLGEAEGLALEFGVEVVVPPPNRLEK